MDKPSMVKIDRLDNLMEETLVLPNTPGLMSAGKLQSKGFSFYWTHGFLPWLVSQDTNTLVVLDVCGNLPMVIQGGVFDLIRDLPTLLELCGAKITSENGKHQVQFELLGEDEPLRGLIKYEELKASGLLDLPTSDHSANAVFVSEPIDDETKYYGGSAKAERVRDEMGIINDLSHDAGARSSHEPPAPTRPASEKKGFRSQDLSVRSSQRLSSRGKRWTKLRAQIPQIRN